MDQSKKLLVLETLARMSARVASAETDDEMRAALTLEGGQSFLALPAETNSELVLETQDGAALSKRPPPPKFTAEAKEVFAYWVERTGHSRAQFTDERKRVIVARLRQGYSVAALKHAIDGCMTSTYHVEHDYIELTLICRNGEKVEWFSRKAGDMATEDTANEDPRIPKLKEQMREARAKGKRDEYERINTELAGLLKRRK